MTRIRRGGYVFFKRKADHPPRHVHVYLDDELVLKWDLENHRALKGVATPRLLELISELREAGVL